MRNMFERLAPYIQDFIYSSRGRTIVCSENEAAASPFKILLQDHSSRIAKACYHRGVPSKTLGSLQKRRYADASPYKANLAGKISQRKTVPQRDQDIPEIPYPACGAENGSPTCCRMKHISEIWFRGGGKGSAINPKNACAAPGKAGWWWKALTNRLLTR